MKLKKFQIKLISLNEKRKKLKIILLIKLIDFDNEELKIMN